MENIEIIKKNNELFANALTYKIIGKQNFNLLLVSGGFDYKYIEKYTLVIEKYIKDYEEKLKIKLQSLNK